jgi:hypothetical protein
MAPRDIRRSAMLFDACANVHADVLFDDDSRNVVAETTKAPWQVPACEAHHRLMLW